MLNNRLAAAKAVYNELAPAEADVDNAIVHAAKLAIAVVEGRRSAHLPLTAGQEGLAHVSRASLRLVEAREELCAAHAAFRATQVEIGLRAVSFGNLWECPPNTGELPSNVANVA
ncbi:hypothetical protein [Sphingomonas sp. LHG3406-1]|uniref:hypothetical protein n=1 Tax=Sphingomonas sp. LHG3406-1 TaxID=2804617 RepID=UPI002614B7F4|nr:hypothetical protein [Sphingomonas sp. LHG3406-1]